MLNYFSWVEEKIKIAQNIKGGCCGGSYDEGALIICATISAMSALAWPGRGIDKERFVEILAEVANAGTIPSPLTISVPLLCQEDKSFEIPLSYLKKSFYLTTAVDSNYSELINVLNQKGIAIGKQQEKTIKHNSYGYLLYNQVRCGFAHEYKIGNNATSFDQLRDIAKVAATDVSYVNSTDGNRRIHFPLDWISCLAKNVAQWLDEKCLQENKYIFENLNLQEPPNWWIS